MRSSVWKKRIGLFKAFRNKEELDLAEPSLDTAMNEWEKLNAEYEALITDDN